MTAAEVASAQTKKLMKFSLSLFRRGFNSSKCKTAAKMAVARIKLLRNKRLVVVKQMRRDIAVLLQSGQDATARIRVEHVIREQNIQAANEIIELFCELIVARLTIITKQKQCPVDLKEGIASLIFAAPRCSEIPELGDLRDIFEKKYGKDFVSAATDLRPSCGVNRMLIDKLSVRNPSGECKLKIMKEIAKEFQVDWDTTETEQELLKPQEESIDGPRKFVSASSLPVNRAAINEPFDPTKAVPRSTSSMGINTHYHDTESAAEAATELAKQAVAAAQVASLLATRRDSTKEFSVSSDHSTNQKDSQYMDHYHHHPGSRRESRDSETSSYYAKPSAENRGMGIRHSYNNPGINESDYEEDYTKTKAEAKETMRRRHSYNSRSVPPPATSEIKFDESDYYEEETEPEEPSHGRVSSLPPNREPPQAPQSGESRRDSSGHHVHPKLPDYDILAARFEAIRHSKGPLI
ncbi:Vacuolar protein sorting-associated protein Ist1 [Arabidopsis thaliana x Arabidopsis arenosa]|uniref:Vacuolar protein sorting-associated protein Ist1 n=2 Tax=Arabidopsis thaliana x Arabidopsis arenosa TaxID=1240361 RepID=A0A8T1XYR2_9BRAS|nr:Vacuolar protein sorting-associated protein Ist1 [Arabidopsis thaliana x Arabidopsis arenosa]